MKISNLSPTSKLMHKPLRVLLAGDGDAGKTTLARLLSNGVCDSECGSAGKPILSYKDEKDTGLSITPISYLLPYTKDGTPILTCVESKKPQKMISLLDICGSPANYKATIYAMTSTCPDYLILVINSATGLTETIKEYIGLALALRIPLILALNKADLSTPEDSLDAMKHVKDFLGIRTNKEIEHIDDLVDPHKMSAIAEKLEMKSIILVHTYSCFSGEGVAQLHSLLFNLKSTKSADSFGKEPTEVWVQKVSKVKDVGIVVEGLLKQGKIRKGQILQLGPIKGLFYPVCINNIIDNNKPVLGAQGRTDITLHITTSKGDDLNVAELKTKKGLVLLTKPNPKRIASSFDAEIIVLSNSEIKVGSEFKAYTGSISQQAKIETIDGKEQLLQGEKSLVNCTIGKSLAYLQAGELVVFLSGFISCIGVITHVYPK